MNMYSLSSGVELGREPQCLTRCYVRKVKGLVNKDVVQQREHLRIIRNQ